MALNVPVPDGSAVDLVAQMERPASPEAVNEAMREAAAGPLSGLIEYSTDPIVSSDVIVNSNSGVFDSLSTQGLGEDVVRVLVWFNNGWGYAHRALDLVSRLASQTPSSGGEVSG
jgi:glyceraldehyde 3-phosphate dehydrogenase